METDEEHGSQRQVRAARLLSHADRWRGTARTSRTPHFGAVTRDDASLVTNHVVLLSHDGQWVGEAGTPPWDMEPPLDAARTDAMRAWSHMPLQVEQPDLLLRLATTPRQAVVAALDGVVRETTYDPFEREEDGSFAGQPLSCVVWDATATVHVLRRLTFLLLKTAERMKAPSHVAVLRRYDQSLARYLQRLRAGEVRLVPFDADDWEREAFESLTLSDDFHERAQRDLEEAFRLRLVKDDVVADSDLGTAYVREGATPELRRYLRAQRLKKQRGEGEPVFDSLDEALATDSEHVRSSSQPLTMEQVSEQRRRERAQRLKERRGGSGEVVTDDEPGEGETPQPRLMRDSLQHPDIIWDE